MGGPTNPHCFGRVDDADGNKSDIFGVTDSWQDTDCVVQGNCQEPMGAVKVGLIYVNPEGPLNDPNDLNSGQNPDPEKSAVEIREVFGRMGMNDSETASLIAGGHAFGKCHGAGVMTSGFEGPWTTTPSQWTNQFLTGMLDEEWEQVATPSGSAVQWQTKDRTSILAGTMRLTADLALVSDDAYLALAKHWVCDQQKLDIAFAASWKKLVESGGGWLPVEDRRCEPESKATGQQTDPQKNFHSVCATTTTDDSQEPTLPLNSVCRFWRFFSPLSAFACTPGLRRFSRLYSVRAPIEQTRMPRRPTLQSVASCTGWFVRALPPGNTFFPERGASPGFYFSW
ncbi:unnamed protein product [Prorocentrum cordatum]|uniref:Plant heme peroxidase family profile domain-containing protein n=1 Tax=Prorocentrum cordatum TaxID=2364126 RepID=A0ABN9R8B6_9DINO|nr:unnamed protein product [Polarella glacialis]